MLFLAFLDSTICGMSLYALYLVKDESDPLEIITELKWAFIWNVAIAQPAFLLHVIDPGDIVKNGKVAVYCLHNSQERRKCKLSMWTCGVVASKFEMVITSQLILALFLFIISLIFRSDCASETFVAQDVAR